ncbi:hypothetical protein Tco_0893372 [Tanacetum coccineum]|uniref:Uncharacterized protein n=1 Tax=Tanacetum coccineum TaxID=301880 RepID=A0ABQ5C952_9ASTR
MFRGGRGFVLVCECEWKWGVSVVGLVVMGSVGGGFRGDGGAGDGEVVVEVQARPVNYLGNVFELYFWRAKEADRRLARMINNVSVKLRAAIEEYQLFTQELEASPGWVVNKDSSSGAPSTPSYFAGHSTPPSYFSGPSTPPSYSSGPSTPTNYSLRSSRNRECSNCKHLRGKISVLKATMEMHMHPEQHTVNSAALFHEVLNEMEKLDLE